MLRSAYETTGLSNETIRNLNYAPRELSIGAKGVQGDNLIEPIPNFNKRNSEKVIRGANNTWVVLGRDRPGEVGSGYGNETGAGSIDIVVGRMSSNIQTSIINEQSLRSDMLSVDNNLALDASRIYISQKSDIDKNFNLANGFIGQSTSKAAIAIKSDSIRIIGREGVKIITKVDSKNSQGASIVSVPGIDFIAGNDDSDQQPVVKANVLKLLLKDIIKAINDLNSVLDVFLTSQMEYNSVIMNHQHPAPVQMFLGGMSSGNPMAINGGNVLFSPEVLQAGIKSAALQQLTKHDGIMQKLKLSLTEMDGTEVFGTRDPSSNNVTTS